MILCVNPTGPPHDMRSSLLCWGSALHQCGREKCPILPSEGERPMMCLSAEGRGLALRRLRAPCASSRAWSAARGIGAALRLLPCVLTTGDRGGDVALRLLRACRSARGTGQPSESSRASRLAAGIGAERSISVAVARGSPRDSSPGVEVAKPTPGFPLLLRTLSVVADRMTLRLELLAPGKKIRAVSDHRR